MAEQSMGMGSCLVSFPDFTVKSTRVTWVQMLGKRESVFGGGRREGRGD